MKYITTDKHPELKEGIELTKLDENYYRFYISNDESCHLIENMVINHWLKKGYIKELEEPQFTKSDMIDLSKFLLNNKRWAAREMFNEWKKLRNK